VNYRGHQVDSVDVALSFTYLAGSFTSASFTSNRLPPKPVCVLRLFTLPLSLLALQFHSLCFFLRCASFLLRFKPFPLFLFYLSSDSILFHLLTPASFCLLLHLFAPLIFVLYAPPFKIFFSFHLSPMPVATDEVDLLVWRSL